MTFENIGQFRILIQSRLSSARLPAKALLPIADIPLLVLAAQRAKNRGGDVVVVTGINKENDLIADTMTRYQIPHFRHSEDDVLERFFFATQDLADQDLVVRLTGDNVFPDGEFIHELITQMQAHHLDYFATSWPLSHLPYGMSGEVFRVHLLRKAYHEANRPEDREHVTPWIRENYFQGKFFEDSSFKSIKEEWSSLRCTIDYFQDYLNVCRVFKRIKNPVEVSWKNLCKQLWEEDRESKGYLNSVDKNYFQSRLISSFCMGTVQLGQDYGIVNDHGRPSFEVAKSMVEFAQSAGVNFFDTARAYGQSESVLGKILANNTSMAIVTKLDPLSMLDVKYADKKAEKNAEKISENKEVEVAFIEALVDQSLFASLRNLQVAKFDVLMLHRWSHRLAYNEIIWNRLLSLKEQGLIGALGVSVQNPQEAVEAINEKNIQYIQLPFNILDWRWKEFKIPELCQKRTDLFIFARSVFLQGVLTVDSAQYWPTLSGENYNPQNFIETINNLIKKLGRLNAKDLCLAYARSNKWISSFVIGQETLSQLKENLHLFNMKSLTTEECRYIEDQLQIKQRAPLQLLDPSCWKKEI